VWYWEGRRALNFYRIALYRQLRLQIAEPDITVTNHIQPTLAVPGRDLQTKLPFCVNLRNVITTLKIQVMKMRVKQPLTIH